MEDNFLQEQPQNNYDNQVQSYENVENQNVQQEPTETLPNAVAGMVLGICSLVLGCPIVGLILAIIGLSKSKKALSTNEQYPGYYKGVGFAKAGKITSIVGIVMGIFVIIFTVLYVALIAYLISEGYDVDDSIYEMY